MKGEISVGTVPVVEGEGRVVYLAIAGIFVAQLLPFRARDLANALIAASDECEAENAQDADTR